MLNSNIHCKSLDTTTTLFIDNIDKIFKLDNGLTVILKKSTFLPIVSVQVWVKVGSIYENEQNNGISHFLEHLVFKGTRKYKVSEISKKIEYYGAVINAGTSKEYTIYYTDIPKEGFEDALDVLSQLVFEATFPEEELERERSVVIEEIKRSEDNPVNFLYESFNKLLFTETNYRWRIIGLQKNISELSKVQIISYYKTFYQPKNMVLSICGDIDYTLAENLVKKYFSGYKNNETEVLQFNPLLDEKSKETDIFITKKHKVQHTYFLCGFLGPKIEDKHQYTGDVLSVIVGEGLSSRLYKVLREEKKLVYEIGSGFYTQRGPSIFYIFGICDNKNLQKVIGEIRQILSDLKTNGPTETELKKSKQIITTRWFFENETVHSKASTVAWWYMFKSLDELNLYIKNINNVTKEDIKEFLLTYGKYLTTFALEPD
ncbi:MAG: insulinase family protein [Endomicrobia bacterium]|nr:insulinase family protein [Endomicrobiia bacterium]